MQIVCSQAVPTEDVGEVTVFQTTSSQLLHVPALISLTTHYKWTKLSLIVENKQDYLQVCMYL